MREHINKRRRTYNVCLYQSQVDPVDMREHINKRRRTYHVCLYQSQEDPVDGVYVYMCLYVNGHTNIRKCVKVYTCVC